MTTRADRDHQIERRRVDRSRVFRSKTRTFTTFSTRESNVTAGEVQRSHLCGRVSRSALINRRVDYWNRPRDLPSVSEVLSQSPGNLLLHAGDFWLKLGEFLRASVRYLMWRGREQERESGTRLLGIDQGIPARLPRPRSEADRLAHPMVKQKKLENWRKKDGLRISCGYVSTPLSQIFIHGAD